MVQAEAIDIFVPKKEEKLYRILTSFGIDVQYVRLSVKKFFDIYDVKLKPGVRSSRLDRVLVDLGMSLESHNQPIGYPVMKEGVYRIEVQREEIKSPDLCDVMSAFGQSDYSPIALGSDHHGEPFSVDLNKVPNLLIGGTTGSGKSVLLHSLILSLQASDACLYLIDPKSVEFNVYSNLDCVKALVSSPEEAFDVIEEVREVMENRFDLLKRHRSRNASDFNKKVLAKDRLRPIVVIVDEWADIVLQDKEVQKPLCLLAQKGRAAGISIVLATQRPSCRVISGLIKANFPGRIALKVASAVDSRVIIDAKGAEKITDIGTGLYVDGATSKPILFRAPYISDVEEEILRISPREKPTKSFWQRLVS